LHVHFAKGVSCEMSNSNSQDGYGTLVGIGIN